MLKKVHKVTKFNQKAWLKQYISMNTDLRKVANNDFQKDFFRLMNNSVFGKTMENDRKHRDFKLVTKERRVAKTKLSYYKVFHRRFVSNRNEKQKKQILVNKSFYLGLSILDQSKTVMY